MEEAFWHTTESLRFRSPHIPQSFLVMVMELTFQTKDPDGVGDALNILLFTDFSPSPGYGGGLPHAEVGNNIGGRDLDLLRVHYFSDGGSEGCSHGRMGRSRVPARGLGRVLHFVSGRRRGSSCHLLYFSPHGGDIQGQPEAVGASPPKNHLPSALIFLIQQEFSEIFSQAL